MNLAIVIGVSKYENLKNLPACENDSNYFYNLLKLSEKYEKILYLNNKTKSNEIMNEIDNFVAEYANLDINECVIYFSGHGHYNDDEFYFCTSDIDISNINSTSISNSDLDRVIRKLLPHTYIKIIDACESGNSYIKKVGNMDYIFKKNTGEFKNCYFFSSSMNTQSSYASESISFFTKAFIEIVQRIFVTDKQKEIKYRQISAALSDAFLNNNNQTPFFVLQGSLSEIFLRKNVELENFLKNLVINKLMKNDEDCLTENHVTEVSKLIPSKDEALLLKEKLIGNISTQLINGLNDLLKGYNYKRDIKNIKVKDVHNKYVIGQWLLENKDKCYIFATEIYSRSFPDYNYKVSSFKLDVNEDESIYQIELYSENHLPKYCCQLVIMYSLTKMYIFFDFSFLHPKNWDEYSEYNTLDKVQIITQEIKDKSSLKLNVSKICDDFQGYCLEHLKKYLEVLFSK